jgi:uncharacterized membrane protein YkvA (DUF1232 family)
MRWETWLLICVAALLGLYAGFVVLLMIAGRREGARALAGFVPDCIVLFGRMVGDRRLGWRRRAVLVALLAYLSLPLDLVPDFIPVAGQLDDAILVALVLRYTLRAGGPALLREHWPGPEDSLNVVIKLAYGPSAGSG